MRRTGEETADTGVSAWSRDDRQREGLALGIHEYRRQRARPWRNARLMRSGATADRISSFLRVAADQDAALGGYGISMTEIPEAEERTSTEFVVEVVAPRLLATSR
jgi:hypothetical protein